MNISCSPKVDGHACLFPPVPKGDKTEPLPAAPSWYSPRDMLPDAGYVWLQRWSEVAHDLAYYSNKTYFSIHHQETVPMSDIISWRKG